MRIATKASLHISVIVAAIALAPCDAAASRTVDRLYLFGDDSRENAVDGGEVDDNSTDPPFNDGTTIDSAGVLGGQQIVNLEGNFGFGPTYVEVTDRPDFVGGDSGFAVRFDGDRSATFDHLQGNRLGTPETSITDISAGGSIDYFFILDRGMQFWTKPEVLPTGSEPADDAHIVMDTNNHGALINTNGRYAMRYNGEDFEGIGDQAVATVNEWDHIMVVRPSRVSPDSRMYVNGVAVAAASGDYAREAPLLGGVADIPDTAPLVIGAGTEPVSGFSQGFINNYNGIVDDLEMFVLGLGPGGDYGEFDFIADNQYAALFAPSVPVDLANDDGAVTMDDVDVFVSNWLSEKRINNVLIGDLETVAIGDFDYSGRVDIDDWSILNAANPQMAAIALARIQAIPEPSAAALAVLALGLTTRRRG